MKLRPTTSETGAVTSPPIPRPIRMSAALEVSYARDNPSTVIPTGGYSLLFKGMIELCADGRKCTGIDFR